jgi:hypothetical protein
MATIEAFHESRTFELTSKETQWSSMVQGRKDQLGNWRAPIHLGEDGEFHLGNAMRKLGAGNRITAVVIGIKRGLIGL